jgi:hypothetical protein
MSYQGKGQGLVRAAALGLAAVGAAATLTGCATQGSGGGPTAMRSAAFDIAFDTTAAGDEAVIITPEHGDAWLVSAEDGSSTLEWSADSEFGIKFVQIDDQTKEQKNKFSSRQKAGWNEAKCDSAGKNCKLLLPLDAGSKRPHKKKEIRGAKYIVASPSGCTDEKPMPANCKYQDPVIIVRY